jgi:ABC-type glycerol-3-phosphate transport system permease component
MDTKTGLVIVYLTFNVPLAVFILKGFLDDMPKDYEEAAMVDGCSRIQSMWRITLPMSGPGIVAISIVIFLFSFNEFMFAYVLTTRNAVTLTAQAAVFITEFSMLWADLAAAMMLMILPMMIATILLQGRIVKGLRTGLKL